MTGQDLMRIVDAQVFKPTVMDAIINEFIPDTDTFFLTDKFLPFKLVDQELLIDLINHGAFGRTFPVALAAEHRRIGIPGYEYKMHTAGHWREAVQYGEDVLQRAINPQQPTQKAGEQLAVTALNLLDLRLNVLIEYITAKMIINGSYSEARNGINYTYDPKIPAKYFRNVTSTPGWTSGGTWATASSATPITDLVQLLRLAQFYGLNVSGFIMSLKTALDFLNAKETQDKIKASFQLVGRGQDIEGIFQTLVGKPLTITERYYAEESRLTAASAVNDTTIDVEDATPFTAADVCTMRNSLGEEEEVTISSISSNTITISSGVVKAYAKGDRFTVYKRFFPNDYVVAAGSSNQLRSGSNNWISTPSLIKAQSWNKQLPGRYTWMDFQTKVPYKLEIGAGVSGGPKVSKCDWMTMKTTA